MRKEILDIICCPTCKGNLSLEVGIEKNGEIIEGRLICERCEAVYIIEDGIPNLLPKNV